MDGSMFEKGLVQTWTDPRDPQHPHQMWLRADREDMKANFAAYNAARSDISLQVCMEVFELHDSAQHHFITMLLWNRSGSGCMSVAEALENAQKHHQGLIRV